jgi:hypothetical protein
MEQLPTVARNLLIVAGLPWLFCLFTVILPIIRLGFEATTVYVGLAYIFGASLALIAFALSLLSLIRYGRTGTRVKICLSSIGTILAFGALMLVTSMIGAMAADT